MAIKISELPVASPAAGTDEIPTNQGGTTRKLTAAQIATHALGSVPSLPTASSVADTDNLLVVQGGVARRANVSQVSAVGFPTGGIIMWSGSVASIPSGWALCNGSNGTPDLRDRFIVGAGSAYTPGNTGGANSVTLTTAQIPSHNHTGSTGENGWHNHSGTTDVQGDHSHTHSGGGFTGEGQHGGTSTPTTLNTGVAGAHAHNLNVNHAGAHTHDFTTAATGGGESHENRPPYYALAFIMKL